MKTKKVLLLTLFTVLASATPAMANMAPGPQEILSEVLIIIFLVALTAIGGGYAIIARKVEAKRKAKGKGKKSGVMGWAGCVVGFIVAMLLSMMGPALLFVIAFGVWAVVRGGAMVYWGLKARSDKRPAYLEGANPKRLIPSGVVLVVISIFLVSGAFVFYLFHMQGYMGGHYRGANLQRLVAVEMARMLPHEELTVIVKEAEEEVSLPTGVKAKDKPFTVEEVLEKLRLKSEELSKSYPNAEPVLERDAEKKTFTIHLPPVFLVPFPYNYMGGGSSAYRADYVDHNDYEAEEKVLWEARIGVVKKCTVKRKDERCRATDPTYRSVKEEEVLRAIYEVMYSR